MQSFYLNCKQRNMDKMADSLHDVLKTASAFEISIQLSLCGFMRLLKVSAPNVLEAEDNWYLRRCCAVSASVSHSDVIRLMCIRVTGFCSFFRNTWLEKIVFSL